MPLEKPAQVSRIFQSPGTVKIGVFFVPFPLKVCVVVHVPVCACVAAVVGVLPDAGVNVATAVETLFTALLAPRNAITLTPIQAKSNTAMMPRAIHSPVRRFFGGGWYSGGGYDG